MGLHAAIVGRSLWASNQEGRQCRSVLISRRWSGLAPGTVLADPSVSRLADEHMEANDRADFPRHSAHEGADLCTPNSLMAPRSRESSAGPESPAL